MYDLRIIGIRDRFRIDIHNLHHLVEVINKYTQIQLLFPVQVRVQCFHYLKANASDRLKNAYARGSDSLEPDLKVQKLTKVLAEMEEAMMATLHPRKTKVR